MTDKLLIALGDRIRELRVAKGWSQEEMAYQAGLHRTYVGHVELGKKNISFGSLVTITAALGVRLSDLFAGLEDSAGPRRGKSQAKPVPQSVEPNAKTSAVISRLLTELRLQRALMERVLTTLGPGSNRRMSKARRGR